MPRWRTETWAFIIWNVTTAALLWSLYSRTVGSPCDGLPDTSACGMEGLWNAFVFLLGLLVVGIIWLIGLIIIGIAWWKGRGGKARDTSHPKAAQERLQEIHDGSTEDEAPSEATQDDANDASD